MIHIYQKNINLQLLLIIKIILNSYKRLTDNTESMQKTDTGLYIKGKENLERKFTQFSTVINCSCNMPEEDAFTFKDFWFFFQVLARLQALRYIFTRLPFGLTKVMTTMMMEISDPQVADAKCSHLCLVLREREYVLAQANYWEKLSTGLGLTSTRPPYRVSPLCWTPIPLATHYHRNSNNRHFYPRHYSISFKEILSGWLITALK